MTGMVPTITVQAPMIILLDLEVGTAGLGVVGLGPHHRPTAEQLPAAGATLVNVATFLAFALSSTWNNTLTARPRCVRIETEKTVKLLKGWENDYRQNDCDSAK